MSKADRLFIENCKEIIKVGDVVRFKLRYSAILHLTMSENVNIYETSEIGVLL